MQKKATNEQPHFDHPPHKLHLTSQYVHIAQRQAGKKSISLQSKAATILMQHATTMQILTNSACKSRKLSPQSMDLYIVHLLQKSYQTSTHPTNYQPKEHHHTNAAMILQSTSAQHTTCPVAGTHEDPKEPVPIVVPLSFSTQLFAHVAWPLWSSLLHNLQYQNDCSCSTCNHYRKKSPYSWLIFRRC